MTRMHRPRKPQTEGAKKKRASAFDRRNAIFAAFTGSTLSANARHVIRALEDWADNSTGIAFPSIATLAARMGCTPQTVRNGIDEAINAGWLEVEKDPTSLGTHKFRAKLPTWSKIFEPAQRKETEEEKKARKPREQAAKGVNQVEGTPQNNRSDPL